MTEEELDRIETKLDLKLPPSYRAFMLDYPEGLDERLQIFELRNDVDQIIEHNLHVRDEGWFTTIWPDRYFIIGTSPGLQEYFFEIDEKNVSDGGGVVYLANPEDDLDIIDQLEECRAFSSFKEYVEHVFEVYRDREAVQLEAEAMTMIFKKKWWHFWK